MFTIYGPTTSLLCSMVERRVLTYPLIIDYTIVRVTVTHTITEPAVRYTLAIRTW